MDSAGRRANQFNVEARTEVRVASPSCGDSAGRRPGQLQEEQETEERVSSPSCVDSAGRRANQINVGARTDVRVASPSCGDSAGRRPGQLLLERASTQVPFVLGWLLMVLLLRLGLGWRCRWSSSEWPVKLLQGWSRRLAGTTELNLAWGWRCRGSSEVPDNMSLVLLVLLLLAMVRRLRGIQEVLYLRWSLGRGRDPKAGAAQSRSVLRFRR